MVHRRFARTRRMRLGGGKIGPVVVLPPRCRACGRAGGADHRQLDDVPRLTGEGTRQIVTCRRLGGSLDPAHVSKVVAMSPKKVAHKAKKSKGFTAEERAAM